MKHHIFISLLIFLGLMGCKNSPTFTADNELDPESSGFSMPEVTDISIQLTELEVTIRWNFDKEHLRYLSGFKIFKSVSDTSSFKFYKNIESLTSPNTAFTFTDPEPFNSIAAYYKVQPYFVRKSDEDTVFAKGVLVSKLADFLEEGATYSLYPFQPDPKIEFFWMFDAGEETEIQIFEFDPISQTYTLIHQDLASKDSLVTEFDVEKALPIYRFRYIKDNVQSPYFTFQEGPPQPLKNHVTANLSINGIDETESVSFIMDVQTNPDSIYYDEYVVQVHDDDTFELLSETPYHKGESLFTVNGLEIERNYFINIRLKRGVYKAENHFTYQLQHDTGFKLTENITISSVQDPVPGSVAISPNGEWLAAGINRNGANEGKLLVYKLPNLLEHRVSGVGTAISNIQFFEKNGNTFLAQNDNSTHLKVLDVANSKTHISIPSKYLYDGEEGFTKILDFALSQNNTKILISSYWEEDASYMFWKYSMWDLIDDQFVQLGEFDVDIDGGEGEIDPTDIRLEESSYIIANNALACFTDLYSTGCHSVPPSSGVAWEQLLINGQNRPLRLHKADYTTGNFYFVDFSNQSFVTYNPTDKTSKVFTSPNNIPNQGSDYIKDFSIDDGFNTVCMSIHSTRETKVECFLPSSLEPDRSFDNPFFVYELDRMQLPARVSLSRDGGTMAILQSESLYLYRRQPGWVLK